MSACGGGSATPPPLPPGTPAPASQPTGSPGDIDWPTFALTATRNGENISETLLTPSTVSRLHLLWSQKIGDGIAAADTQPIVAANVTVNGANLDIVYAGDEHGYFVALNALSGAVLWSKHLGSQATACGQFPGGIFGITDTGVIDRTRNRVYVADGSGKLVAFDLATGNVASGWPSGGVQVVDNSTLDHVWSALTFDASEGLLFVTTASYCDNGIWNGALRAVNVQSATVTNVFYFGTGTATMPTASSYGGGVWGWGGVAIDPATHNLYGASGNVEPTELAPYSDSLNEWSPLLAPIATNEPPPSVGDDDFGGSAVVYDEAGAQCVGAMRKDGTLFVYDRTHVAAGPTVSLVLGNAGAGNINAFVHSSSTHVLYVNNPSTGPYARGLYAFAAQANCTLDARVSWVQRISVSTASPTVANGVVFDPAGSQLFAFSAATGAQLWNSGTSIGGAMQNSVTVVNGRVYVVDWTDTIYAFGL